MNLAIKRLLEQAHDVFVSDSQVSIEGKILAAYIEGKCTPNTEPRDIREETMRLRHLIALRKEEIRNRNMLTLNGLLVARWHPNAYLREVLQDTNDPKLKDYLNQYIEKGDTYEL